MLTLRTVTSLPVTTQAKPTLQFQFLLPVQCSQQWGLLGGWDVLHHTAEPQETSEQGKTQLPRASRALCTEQGHAWLKAGLWHRQEQARGGGEAPAVSRGFARAACAGAPVCHHSGISRSVQTLCVCWESHRLEVNLLMQQNTLFQKGQQVKLCWNINLITWAVGRNGHQPAQGCSAKSC